MGTAEAVNSHKDQGNEFFKAEMWLKAAACYTKGIKDNANDAVLYRQAKLADQPAAACRLRIDLLVLMQQSLCSVAQVAEGSQSPGRCGDVHTVEARLAKRSLSERHGVGSYGRPTSGTWHQILRLRGNPTKCDRPTTLCMQALHSYEEAAKLQSGADLSHKITSLKKAIRRGGTVAPAKTADKGTGSTFAFGSSSIVDAAPSQESRIAAAPVIGAVKDDDDYQEAKKSMVSLVCRRALTHQSLQCKLALTRTCALQTNGKAIPLSTHRIQQFGKEIVAQVQQQLHEQKPIKPTVYFLPGR